MTALTSQKIDVGGVATNIVRGGTGGARFVFLHGGVPGVTPYVGGSHLWAGTLERFAEHGEVVAIDLIGSGGTDYPDDAPVKVQAIGEHVLRVLEQLDIKDCHLVGHDLGGLVALWLGIRGVGRVRSLSVVASSFSTPIGDAWEDLTLADPPAPLWGRASQAWALDRLSWSDGHIDAALLDAAEAAAGAAGVARASRAMASAEAQAAFLGSHIRARGEIWSCARTAGYPVPVQIVWGRQDPLTTIEHGHVLVKAIGKHQRATQLHLVNEAGSFVFREQPETFLRIVRSFVEGVAEEFPAQREPAAATGPSH